MTVADIYKSLTNDTNLLFLLALVSLLIGVLNAIKINIDNNVSVKSFNFYYVIAEEAFISFVAVPLVFYVLITFVDPYILILLKDTIDERFSYLSVLISALISLLFSRDLVRVKNYKGLLRLIILILTKGRK